MMNGKRGKREEENIILVVKIDVTKMGLLSMFTYGQV